MATKDKIKAIQKILRVTTDGTWGKQTQFALDTLLYPTMSAENLHHVKASSFADPADVRAFRKCKDKGKSDQECFKVGDNGIGCWGDSTAEGSGPSCALPPEDMEEKWGSVNGAKHKMVEVTGNGKTVVCRLKDRMPRRANIKNKAGIDLNPDAVRVIGLEPPIMIDATWKWAA